ncbi:MAG: hypothetical protein QNK04_02800 [Myxococcota bacterium]|nr:hypothetical protein [Myxococcota bacterium]
MRGPATLLALAVLGCPGPCCERCDSFGPFASSSPDGRFLLYEEGEICDESLTHWLYLASAEAPERRRLVLEAFYGPEDRPPVESISTEWVSPVELRVGVDPQADVERPPFEGVTVSLGSLEAEPGTAGERIGVPGPGGCFATLSVRGPLYDRMDCFP